MAVSYNFGEPDPGKEDFNRRSIGRSIDRHAVGPSTGSDGRRQSLASSTAREPVPLMPVMLSDEKGRLPTPGSATKAIACSSCWCPRTTPELWSVDTPRTPILARSTLKGTSTELISSRLRSRVERSGVGDDALVDEHRTASPSHVGSHGCLTDGRLVSVLAPGPSTVAVAPKVDEGNARRSAWAKRLADVGEEAAGIAVLGARHG